MLHPRVGDDDEKSANPRSQKNSQGRPPMPARAEAFLAVEEESQECRLEKESEHAFHGQSLPDHPSGKTREVRPVRAELEFHGDAGDDAKKEVDAEDPRPETSRAAIS